MERARETMSKRRPPNLSLAPIFISEEYSNQQKRKKDVESGNVYNL